ncbi:hypothetical protein BX666DRAFT_1960234 [Dichotomocladium elegans]|nr:hypothetical protein BX666DRAFT_1960234 [Dichotomocladium elegans]
MSNSQTNDRDAMSLLSTYMLQGWVMTDGQCQIPDCPVPIMRSKDGSIRFCVVHDPLPTGPSQSSIKQGHPSPNVLTSSPLPRRDEEPDRLSDSTQKKDISIDKAEEARKRREQSSRASKLIGEKLLQRWTLLNEICSNPDCYAIPLMRDLSKRVICVVCGQIFAPEEQVASSVGAAAVPAPQEANVPVPSAMEKAMATPVMSKNQEQKQNVHLTSGESAGNTSYPAFADAIKQKLCCLTDRMALCQDPVELKLLFEAIGAGVSALKECEQLSK